jgi:hypothetical protein
MNLGAGAIRPRIDWIVVTYGARIIAPEFPADTVRMCRKCGAYEIT